MGLRAKTGRAIAVVLTAEERPAFILREELSLVDPRMPETAQPYHVVMELPWPEAIATAAPFVKRIGEVAFEAVSALLGRVGKVQQIAIVGTPDRNLARLGNPHIRAHAAEGILYRRALEVAAQEHRLKWRTFPGDSFEPWAQLERIGRDAGPPWRADEKAAAAAAWLAFSHEGGRRTQHR